MIQSKLNLASVSAFCIGVLSAVVVAFSTTPAGADPIKQQQLVDKSRMTLENFAASSTMAPMIRDLMTDAKAIFIVPQFLRGAFIFGGAGGSGVLLVRDEKTGEWSEPAFYTIGSGSFGLQIGGDVSEIIMVVRNEKGLEEFYRSDFKLGADASIAVGPVGAGASVKGIAADIVAYARKKGAYAGISVTGAGIAVSEASNAAYYGKAVRPTDIVVKRAVTNPKSAGLRAAAAKMTQ